MVDMSNSGKSYLLIVMALLCVILLGVVYVISSGTDLFQMSIPIISNTKTPTLDFVATEEAIVLQTQENIIQQTESAYAIETQEQITQQTAEAILTQDRINQEVATAMVVLTQFAEQYAIATQEAFETEVAFAIALETEYFQATQTEIAYQTQEAFATSTPSFNVITRAIDNMEMVLVPAGEFNMGAREDDDPARNDEKPIHTVYLDVYYIDRFEITTTQYALYLNATDTGNRWMPDKKESHIVKRDGIWTPTAGFENHPITYIYWRGALDYCEWVGGSLPTEAQWEKAARGMDERRYPWGDEFKSTPIRLNFYDDRYDYMDDGYDKTAPVGTYSEGLSPYGAYDMSGNVWEWVFDWYAPIYKKRVGVVTYNPTGAVGGDGKIYRGGSYESSFIDFRTTERRLSDDPRIDLGWRCIVIP